MAKKILYKIRAYHCPRCGSVTEPTKKYCEYCERDLAIRSNNKNKIRLLIDCGDYIYFDNISNIDLQERYEYLDATTLYDSMRQMIPSEPIYDISFKLPITLRGRELSSKLGQDYRSHKIRLEHLGANIAYEATALFYSSQIEIIDPKSIAMQTVRFEGVGGRNYDSAIPKEVLTDMRCPNCGAPIRSQYGACDYCSGWNEVEW